MFKYTYKTRGFSIGCQPKDVIKFEQEEHKFETIYYDRKLSLKEIEEYELIDLNEKDILQEIENIIDKAYKQIDKSLDYGSYERLEYGISLGLEDMLEIKRLIKEKKNEEI